MMLKTVLFAVLATILVAEISVRAVAGRRLKTIDYDEMLLPNINISYTDPQDSKNNFTLESFFIFGAGYDNLTVIGSFQDSDPEEGWTNTSYSVSYPNAFLFILANQTFIENGQNHTNKSITYIDASKTTFLLNVFFKTHEEDDGEHLDFLAVNVTGVKPVLTIPKIAEEAEDVLDNNEGAKDALLAKLSPIYGEYAEKHFNSIYQSDDDEEEPDQEFNAAAVRTLLRRGPLKHVRLPKWAKSYGL